MLSFALVPRTLMNSARVRPALLLRVSALVRFPLLILVLLAFRDDRVLYVENRYGLWEPVRWVIYTISTLTARLFIFVGLTSDMLEYRLLQHGETTGPLI